MPKISSITPCLWFDSEAEDAARFYTSVFPGSRITRIARYPKVGQEVHGRQPGSVMIVDFELSGEKFRAMNGGPQFKLSEAISLQIGCDTQEDVDYFWARLCEGGGSPSQCGWLKDRFGLSWQVTPTALLEIMTGADPKRAERAFQAMLEMQKLDIAELQRAAAG